MASTIRILLAALVAGAGLVLFAPTQAYACSCVVGESARFAKQADVVFTATMVDYAPPPEQPIMSSSDPATYTFDVDTVFKGSTASTTQVLSAWSGASCGLENMDVGNEYLVFATSSSAGGRETDELWASLCGGTGRATQNKVADVEAVTGPGQPPELTAADPTAAEPADDEASASNVAGEGEGSESKLTTVAVAGGGLLLLVVLGGFVTYVRRDKEFPLA